MSLFDFCGTWIERRDGDSLEPLMRAMKVRESKIKESVRASPTQRIWIKGASLVMAYSSEMGDVVSSFKLNGGWQMTRKTTNASKQIVSRCTYEPAKRLLVIEKKLLRQGGILKDERFVEMDSSNNVILKQRLEFTPLVEGTTKNPDATTSAINSSKSVIANRVWERAPLNAIDQMLDRLRGVWVIDEEASESLRPIFEAMQLPSGSIRSALALRTQHSIYLSGPRELLFVNQSLHGDMKSATHPVRDTPPDNNLVFPEKGKMICYATSPNCITLLSTSEDGSSSNRDDRTVSIDGSFFSQRISFCPTGGKDVVVNRRWKRAPVQPKLWIDTLPREKSAAPPTNSANQTAVLKPANEIRVADGTAKTSLSVEVERKQTETTATVGFDASASPAKFSPLSSSESTYALLVVILAAGTILRFVMDDLTTIAVLLPCYLLLRSRFSNNIQSKLVTPWIRTVVLSLVATLALFHPSKGRVDFVEDLADSVFLVAALCVWGLSRFYSQTRTSYLITSSDQWVAFLALAVLTSVVAAYGLPLLVRGNDENEPGLAAIIVFLTTTLVWFRVYIWSGPPPPALNEEEKPEEVEFSVAVEKARISENGSFAEYLVHIKLPSGKEYEKWQRYSSFRAFRDEMGRHDIPFPTKRVFGSTSEEVMADRTIELDGFIKTLFLENGNQKFLQTSHEARLFVGAPPSE